MKGTIQRNPIIPSSILLFILLVGSATAHEAKDFDDSIIYKIDFDIPKIELDGNLPTFQTQDKEKYMCQIPRKETLEEKERTNEPKLSPMGLLHPIFTSPTCSYRIEAYWSYEICHGHHVRQYHEEREGKSVKFQEYYLGKWSQEKTDLAKKEWEAEALADIKPKYKTLKIDNTRYPYFEMEFTDGTMCDIINAPRTTMVRYVCYPHGKNDIYSLKETSSCNYEAIVLTSTLCLNPSFKAEEAKEISIKCFKKSNVEGMYKPIGMLRQELAQFKDKEEYLPELVEHRVSAKFDGDLVTLEYNGNLDMLLQEEMANGDAEIHNEIQQISLVRSKQEFRTSPITDLTPVIDFISGKNCLTGGTDWWKFEFCYGKHVRQFHKDKNSEVELFLGYFSEDAHRQWASSNPDKSVRIPGITWSLWHHYEKGTHCDRTGLPREVDVKLTCTPVGSSHTAVSMFLLEPKTCQYNLVVQSPIICDLMNYADEAGLVTAESIQKFLESDKPPVNVVPAATAGSAAKEVPTAPTPASEHSTESAEGQIRS